MKMTIFDDFRSAQKSSEADKRTRTIDIIQTAKAITSSLDITKMFTKGNKVNA